MNLFIYGLEIPKISFRQSPNGSVSFNIENARTIKMPEDQKNITWQDLQDFPYWLMERDFERGLEDFKIFIKEIERLTTTHAERKFFNDYVGKFIQHATLHNAIGHDVSIWNYPALTPQVWVNWIHYDPKDNSRAERARKEPFRVDFMLRDEDISNEAVIFEIDGSSHFADMETYTEHLQKDRWLRKQGWQVYRISNLEVEQYDNFSDFYGELTGKYLDIPF